jgi:hypothetical protein
MKNGKSVVAQKGDKKSASKQTETVVLSKEDYEKLLALVNQSQKKAEKPKKEWVVVKQLKPIPTSDKVSLCIALCKWGDAEYISITKIVKGKAVVRNAYPASLLVNAIKELL